MTSNNETSENIGMKPISNKDLFTKMIERDVNNIIDNIDKLAENLPNIAKNLSPNLVPMLPLITPMIMQKYNGYKNQYLPVVVTYVNSAIDVAFPDGQEVTLEEGQQRFDEEIGNYISPFLDMAINKLNIPPKYMDIAMEVLNQSQHFKLAK